MNINVELLYAFYTLRPRQNGRHFAEDIFKCIFLNENVWIPIKISLKFVPQGPINNIPALVQIMAWRRPGDKPLSGPMMVRLPTHICVTRPQWVNEMCPLSTSEFMNTYTYKFAESQRWLGHKAWKFEVINRYKKYQQKYDDKMMPRNTLSPLN